MRVGGKVAPARRAHRTSTGQLLYALTEVVGASATPGVSGIVYGLGIGRGFLVRHPTEVHGWATDRHDHSQFGLRDEIDAAG